MAAENWNRKTWSLAGPVILSNISVPLLGAVDTAVVGHLPGPHYLGAVAVGALIFSVVYQGCNFLRMGTTGLTAQSLGARDFVEVRAWLAEHRSIEFSLRRAREYVDEALKGLRPLLDDNDYGVVEDIAGFVLARTL